MTQAYLTKLFSKIPVVFSKGYAQDLKEKTQSKNRSAAMPCLYLDVLLDPRSSNDLAGF